MPTPLNFLLNIFRDVAASEREKGTYFEGLILAYLRHEAIQNNAIWRCSWYCYLTTVNFEHEGASIC